MPIRPRRFSLSHATPSRGMLLAIGACALAIVWIIIAVWIGQLRAVGRDAAAREISGFANLFADHTERTIQGVDLLLSLLSSRLEFVLAGEGRSSPGALHAILNRDVAGLQQIRRAFVVDPTGWIIADSQFPEPRAFNAGDRPHFSVHRDDPTVGLYVSEPIESRVDGDWSITLTRRLNGPDGRFLGVVVATLRPEYFTEIFRASVDVRETKVLLWHRSGVLMATGSPAEAPGIGSRFQLPPDFRPGRQGLVTGHSPLFEIERISAYSRSRDYPIMVVVTRPMSAILGASANSERMIVAAGGAMTLLIAAFGWLLLRQMQSLDARFRDGIERMTDGFVLWDSQDRLVAWNSRIGSLLPTVAPFLRPGIAMRHLLTASATQANPGMSPDQITALVDKRMASCDSSEPWEHVTADGRTIEVHASRTQDGGKVTVMRDMTERKKHELALERALHIEREANELHRRFVTLASHEFRTPLAVIDGAAQRLMQEQFASERGGAGKIERIRNAVRSMTMLIDRTLSSARLEAGTISIELQPLDLRQVVLDACERQRQISPGFDIVVSADESSTTMRGDSRLLDQAFSNLLSNAVKYSGRSRRVEVSIERAPDRLCVAVQDHGVGIHADEIDKLFTRFFRARTAQGIAGTGIGLHLTRELVGLHGGRIEVESRLGRGTRFTVVLPAAAAMSQVDAA